MKRKGCASLCSAHLVLKHCCELPPNITVSRSFAGFGSVMYIRDYLEKFEGNQGKGNVLAVLPSCEFTLQLSGLTVSEFQVAQLFHVRS